MTRIEGNYIPSASQWVRDQIDLYESTAGREGATLLDTGIPVIIVASKGGAPDNPDWYANLLVNPTEVTVQDGPEPFAVRVREIDGAEYDQWWQRSVAVFPRYDDYRAKTDRRIPVLLAEPV